MKILASVIIWVIGVSICFGQELYFGNEFVKVPGKVEFIHKFDYNSKTKAGLRQAYCDRSGHRVQRAWEEEGVYFGTPKVIFSMESIIEFVQSGDTIKRVDYGRRFEEYQCAVCGCTIRVPKNSMSITDVWYSR